MKDKKNTTLFLFFVSVVLSISSVILILWRITAGQIQTNIFFGVVVSLVAVIVLTSFIGGSAFSHVRITEGRVRFPLFLFSTCLLMFANLIVGIVSEQTRLSDIVMMYLFKSVGQLFGSMTLITFVRYLDVMAPLNDRYRNIYLKSLMWFSIVYAVMASVNGFTGFMFSYQNGVLQNHSAAYAVIFINGVFLLGLMPFVWKTKMDSFEKYSVYFYSLIPIATSLVWVVIPEINLTPMGVFISACVLYVHSYIRQGEILQDQRIELQDQRSKLMFSQIQPHFIYNALSSIAILCELDPKKAKRLTEDFTDYLRGNLKILQNHEMVFFEKEIKHTETYLRIEHERFGDRLQVELDINAEEFYIPPLTVQPLVENAVKHGVCSRDEGGKVIISSYETDTGYEITIEDNGVGFDAKLTDWEDGTHIGINNTRNRLKEMCNGTLNISSEPGKGTTATIFIPRNREGKHQ